MRDKQHHCWWRCAADVCSLISPFLMTLIFFPAVPEPVDTYHILEFED